MARRRLGPADPARFDPAPARDVPRAEQWPAAGAAVRPPAAAPIARVAGDAAGAAALEEMAATLARARDEGRMVVDLALDQIAPDHLARDRLPLEDEDMAALRESLRAHGQRVPIEVTPVAGALPYGLISGWRRLSALKALHAETGEARFARVQALIRRPESAAEAYVGMVEENEIRVGLSYYERARVAALATRRGIFESEKKALLALFPTASRPKRARIRAFLDIFHALDGRLRFPQALPERLGLKLVEKVRAGEGATIAEALARADPPSPEAELKALAEIVAPAGARPGASARAEEILPGVALEERLRGRTLSLKLTGAGVTPGFRDEVRQALGALRKA